MPTWLTFKFKTTVLAEEVAVPATNVPFTKAPVHAELPPFKLYTEAPFVPPVLAATITENVQPLVAGEKLYVPAVVGVPMAVRVTVCSPVLAKSPELLNDTPLTVFVAIE